MIDWQQLFVLDVPLLEIFVRGSCVYLALFLMLRVLKRQAGSIAVTDILVLVLIADAAQNSMAGDYHSITAGILLVAVIVFWDFALDWLGYHFKPIGKLLYPAPVPLVENGKTIRKNMRSEFISHDELMSTLREQGVDRIEEVKRACMEGDGKISVVTFDKKQKTSNQKTAIGN